jgi:hypothetical protein
VASCHVLSQVPTSSDKLLQDGTRRNKTTSHKGHKIGLKSHKLDRYKTNKPTRQTSSQAHKTNKLTSPQDDRSTLGSTPCCHLTGEREKLGKGRSDDVEDLEHTKQVDRRRWSFGASGRASVPRYNSIYHYITMHLPKRFVLDQKWVK